MPDPDRPNRPKPISWRPPADKRAAFEARVAASGLSINAFLTEAVFGRTRHRPAELRQLARILAEASAAADALRRLERNGRGLSREDLEPIRGDLGEIRSALFLLIGRRP
ncbi:MAG: hypothetical protein AAF192_15560 [Pseudomonadota bacterium]